MQPSKKLSQIPPYLFAELDKKVEAAKAQGRDIISLGVGDPDLPTPQLIVDQLKQSAQDASTHNYPPYQGTKPFRQAVARWMNTRFGVTVDADTETLALIGAKEGIAHLIMAYVDAGDVILAPSPGYPVYNNFTLLSGGTPYTVPLKASNHFLPELDTIPADILAKAKILFLNYPNNPTGAITTEAFMHEAVAFCKTHQILLCHDNAYSEMTFDGYKAPSFLSVPGAKDVCIEMFSLSKMYNMTGWRIGFAVGQPQAIKALGTIKNNCDSGVFKAVQEAAIAGLDNSEALTAGLNEKYAKRRDIFVAGLNDMGWDYPNPEATFYLWVPVPEGYSDVAFAEHLLNACDIVVPPGTGYGPQGAGFFRVALTQPADRIQEAIDRMKANGIRFDMKTASAAQA
ncbi:MAG: LL-diaminopimelate aminotransferase [Cyanobacteria bacterium HKST-UBA06]|nr:LL-diaminopimelate aminotransferase [Cyanobacteria bacterium HKST-UBA04]MCA9806896.1 LL-diaminopimelate aminotransferase [Cyanobacteria bacterium HKST-UBA06]MCA9841836.1 LL-diaminopimelate aminotransferase [Cyanobacteria bacterium HKST-UBA03]